MQFLAAKNMHLVIHNIFNKSSLSDIVAYVELPLDYISKQFKRQKPELFRRRFSEVMANAYQNLGTKNTGKCIDMLPGILRPY